MTQNRCGYARCAAPLDLNGPSLYWCNETCQTRWTKAQQNRPTSLPGGPVRGMTPTLVADDEIANIPDHTWAAAAALLNQNPPRVRLTEAAAIQVLTVTLNSELSRPGWLARAFDRLGLDQERQ